MGVKGLINGAMSQPRIKIQKYVMCLFLLRKQTKTLNSCHIFFTTNFAMDETLDSGASSNTNMVVG